MGAVRLKLTKHGESYGEGVWFSSGTAIAEPNGPTETGLIIEPGDGGLKRLRERFAGSPINVNIVDGDEPVHR